MPDVGEVSRLLSNLLEGLDALYDRWDHAEVWLAWQLGARGPEHRQRERADRLHGQRVRA
jgi:hypothetical protein